MAGSSTKKQDREMKSPCTEQEGRFFFAMVKNMVGKPDINWDGVAKDAGYNNGKSAAVRFFIVLIINCPFIG